MRKRLFINRTVKPVTEEVDDDESYPGDGRNSMGCYCTKWVTCRECQEIDDSVDRAQQRQIDRSNCD
jgi:hypothetical protein